MYIYRLYKHPLIFVYSTVDPAHQSVTMHPPLSTSPDPSSRADSPSREDFDASSIHRPPAKNGSAARMIKWTLSFQV